ncbi:sodium-dependent transporter, partial [Pseudomonas sp. MOB-449]|nr:sodium-dependent transporter [Pseudomonas sp. MOB-449]
VLSFNAWSEVTLLGKNFFDALDFLTSNLMTPLGGLLTVLFTGWALQRTVAAQELGLEQSGAFGLWWLAVRWITPLAILLMFLHSLGLF